MDSLVSTDWLAGNIDQPDLRILECTVQLSPGPGAFVAEPMRDAWAEGHIPSSAYVDLTNDLSDPDSELRFMMPTADRFGAAMEPLGVGDGTRVVLYDRRMTMWATRIFWMLKAFGFDDCAVLDGGWKSWTNEGRTVSTDAAPDRPAATFSALPRPQMIASLDEMESAIADGVTCIVNSLSPENHEGTDHSYGRPGHLPGASNVFAISMLDPETQRFKPVDELAAMFDHLPEGRPIVTYCGGGIAATADAFVLTELLGRTDVSVYDGSLSEWTKDPARPLVVPGT